MPSMRMSVQGAACCLSCFPPAFDQAADIVSDILSSEWPYVSSHHRAMPTEPKSGAQTRRAFVSSSEAASRRDISQGVCKRELHSVTPPLLQTPTHTFCSCQSLWQRLWHHEQQAADSHALPGQPEVRRPRHEVLPARDLQG